MCIDVTQRGYRTGEPDGISRDRSQVWKQVCDCLWSEGKTKKTIAEALCLPFDDIERLTFGLVADSVRPEKTGSLRWVE